MMMVIMMVVVMMIIIAIVIATVIAIITIGIRPKTECLAVGRNQSPFGRNQSRIQPWVAEAMATAAAATKVLSALFGVRAGWKVGPSRAVCGPTPPLCPLPKFHIQAIDAKGGRKHTSSRALWKKKKFARSTGANPTGRGHLAPRALVSHVADPARKV